MGSPDDCRKSVPFQNRLQDILERAGRVMMIVRADARREMDDHILLVPSHRLEPRGQIFHLRRQPLAAAPAAGKCHILCVRRIVRKGAQPVIKITGAPKAAAPLQRVFTLDYDYQFCHHNHSFRRIPRPGGAPAVGKGYGRKGRPFPDSAQDKTKARNIPAAGFLMTCF